MMTTTNRLAGFLALSVEEAAEALGLGRTKVFELVSGGQLRSIKVGRRRLVPVSALEQFITQRLIEEEVSSEQPA
jgi:excisionase family DNA binding protein